MSVKPDGWRETNGTGKWAETSLGKILSTSAAFVAIRIVGAALGILATALLARFLSVEEVGAFGMLMAAASFLSTPINPGISRAMMREISVAFARKDFSEAIGKATRGRDAALLVLALGSVVLSAFAWVVGAAPAAIAACVLIFLFMGRTRLEAAFLAACRDPLAGVKAELAKSAALPLMLAACVLAFGEFGQEGADQGFRLSVALALTGLGWLLSFWLARRWANVRIGMDDVERPDEREIRSGGVMRRVEEAIEVMSASRSHIATGMLLSALAAADIIFAGQAFGAEAAAPFHMAAQVSGLMIFVSLSVQSLISPQIAAAWHENRPSEVRENIASGFIVLLSASVVFLMFFLIFGAHLVGALYGEEYSRFFPIFAMLLASSCMHAVGAPFSSFLAMTGNERFQMQNCIFGLAAKMLAFLAAYAAGNVEMLAASSFLVSAMILLLNARDCRRIFRLRNANGA